MAESGLRATIAKFRNGEWDQLASWQFHFFATVFTIFYTGREFVRDRGHVLAASLAFTTAISLVPLLSVATSILALFGTFDQESVSVQSFLELSFPSVAADAAVYLQEFATSSATGVGGVSALVFALIGVLLFAEMESTFNVIWGAPSDRKLFRKMINFYFVVTLGPILLSLSVGMSARAQFVLERLGLEVGFIGTVFPLLLALALFSLMHWLMPNTKVRWSAALVGGLFTAWAFKAGQWGFNLYVSEVVFDSYRTIYGALSLFPIFLLWVYVSWMIVLLGAELTSSVQNLRTLIEVDAAHQRTPTRQKATIHSPLVGLEVLAPIVRRFKEGAGTMPENNLIRALGYNEVFLRSVLAELTMLKAVRTVEDPETGERGVLPARALEDIPLLPIGEHFFDVSESNSLPMTELATSYRRLLTRTLDQKNALSLLPRDGEVMTTLADPWQSEPVEAPVAANDPKETTVVSPDSQPDSAVAPMVEDELPDEAEYELPPEIEDEDEPYRESTFIDIPDMPEADAELEPPPALPLATKGELTPQIEAPAAIRKSARELVETVDIGQSSPVETPPELDAIKPADVSEPAIPISDDLVIEVSEAFDDDEQTALDVDSDPEIPEIAGGADVSVEIDLGADWDDFDVSEAYDDVLANPSEVEIESPLAGVVRKANELRETADVSLTPEESIEIKRLREIDDM